jgi:hypothetical protein
MFIVLHIPKGFVVSVVREYRQVYSDAFTRNLSLGETLSLRPWWKHKHHGLEMGGTSGDHERGFLSTFYHCLIPRGVSFSCIVIIKSMTHRGRDETIRNFDKF